MKYKLILLKSLIILNSVGIAQSNAEKQIMFSSCFITGNVITNDNNVYTGIIKIGNNDLLWDNLFQAKFINNKHIQNVPEQILKTRKNYSEQSIKWIVGIPFRETVLKKFQVNFVCDYSAISIIRKKNEQVLLKLRNNEILTLKNKTGDLGNDVFVYNEISPNPIKIKWSNIKKIEFKNMLNPSPDEPGIPLYGEVRSKESGIVGIINWDQQEKHNNEFLNGKNKEGQFKIPFKEILCISKNGDRASVELISGNRINAESRWVEIFKDFSNDIGPENQGIIVSQKSVGKIKFNWKNFNTLNFQKLPLKESEKLKSAVFPQKLKGKVKTKSGKTYSGLIVYNLFKERNIEYVCGYNKEGLYYAVPFHNIKYIVPVKEHFALIKLKNNQKLLLGNTSDVNNTNDGLLIYHSEKSTYLSWSDIQTIQFYN